MITLLWKLVSITIFIISKNSDNRVVRRFNIALLFADGDQVGKVRLDARLSVDVFHDQLDTGNKVFKKKKLIIIWYDLESKGQIFQLSPKKAECGHASHSYFCLLDYLWYGSDMASKTKLWTPPADYFFSFFFVNECKGLNRSELSRLGKRKGLPRSALPTVYLWNNPWKFDCNQITLTWVIGNSSKEDGMNRPACSKKLLSLSFGKVPK